MGSKPNAEMWRFATEKEYIHKAAKRGDRDRRTSFRSASLKARVVEYLWEEQGGLRQGLRGRGKGEVISVLCRCIQVTFFCIEMEVLSMI